MEKIIDVTALTDAIKILLWDRSKSREEMIELAIGLIEEAGEEIVRCKDCVGKGDCIAHSIFESVGQHNGYCWTGVRRDSDD